MASQFLTGRRMDDGDSRCQAACFGSGMAAVSAVLGAAAGLMSSIGTAASTSTNGGTGGGVVSSQQDRQVHAVVPKTCYDEAIKLLKMGSGGIASFIRVDMTNLEAVHKALAKHPDRGKVLYMETPDNPLTQVADLEKLVELARFHKAVTVVDTTWSPPVVGQVFRFQVDAPRHWGDSCFPAYGIGRFVTGAWPRPLLRFSSSEDFGHCR